MGKPTTASCAGASCGGFMRERPMRKPRSCCSERSNSIPAMRPPWPSSQRRKSTPTPAGGRPRRRRPWRRPTRPQHWRCVSTSATPLPLWALAGVRIWQRRHDEAVDAAERNVAYNPSFAEGQGMLGFILHYVGRSEEAVKCLERAMALDPYCTDMVLHFHAQATYQLGRYPEASSLLKRRILRNPETDASRALLAAAYGQMGMVEEAREAWRGLMRVNPDYSLEHRRKVLPYKNPDDFERFVEGGRVASSRCWSRRAQVPTITKSGGGGSQTFPRQQAGPPWRRGKGALSAAVAGLAGRAHRPGWARSATPAG